MIKFQKFRKIWENSNKIWQIRVYWNVIVFLENFEKFWKKLKIFLENFRKALEMFRKSKKEG